MRDVILPIIKYALLAMFAGGVFYFALAAQSETGRLRQEERQLKIQIATLKKENDQRTQVIEALKTDPFYIERLLRERYGYRNSDEEEHINIIRIARKPLASTKVMISSASSAKSKTASSHTRKKR